MKNKQIDLPKSHFDFEYSDSYDSDSAPDYGNESYWENRYKSCNENYDWYFEWKMISPNMDQYLNRNGKSLVIGCGNSTMSYEMVSDGFEDIYSIDISPTVIEQMKETYKNIPQLKWEVMDCTNLKYADNTFQSIFDKGTIDAILCKEDLKEQVSKLLKEIYRVLRKNGRFYSITFGSPSDRLRFLKLEKLDWYLYPPISLRYDIDNGKCSKTYVYIFEKK